MESNEVIKAPRDSEPKGLALVVDDDASVREALDSLIRSAGIRVRAFKSAKEFLQNEIPPGPVCLVLDIHLPGVSGLELQRHLALSGKKIPIVFITGKGDIPMTVEAMKNGAIEFLTKPFRDGDLLAAIRNGLERDRSRLEEDAKRSELRRRYELLTRREQEVMRLAAKGLINKRIAAELGIAEITIKVHRGSVMRKMKAESFADLVRMAEKLEP